MSIISFENVSREYVTHRRGNTLREAFKSLFHREKVIVKAVRDVSFSVDKGTIVGLLGKNGAGKSTAIKMLTGVLTATSGRVRVMGFDPFRERRRYVGHIGAVFGQKSQLIWDIPPADSFRMNKAIYGIPTDDYNEQLSLLTGIFGLEDVIQKPTRSLSLGERMKCEFVMAMLHRPQVVFLDEPTIGLDILAKEKIRDFVREMNGKGVTFILTTHDLEDIERLAHTVIVINEGEKVFEDSLDALKRHLGNRKEVEVTTTGGLSDVPLPEGVSISGESEDNTAVRLLVDCDKIGMREFIAFVNKNWELADISIGEPSIEEVIKSIYG